MPNIKFLPSEKEVEVKTETKLLACAIKAKEDIRFSCGASKCGTCAVKINAVTRTKMNQIDPAEKDLLTKLQLKTDGFIRLACRAKIIEGDIEVDLSFQDQYDPEVLVST